MDKTTKKATENFASNENIERVHVQVGISKKNFRNTYLNNKSNIDKHKMTTAISLGAMCMEYHISTNELEEAIVFVLTKRNLNGNS